MTIGESYEQTSERLREYDRCGQDRVLKLCEKGQEEDTIRLCKGRNQGSLFYYCREVRSSIRCRQIERCMRSKSISLLSKVLLLQWELCVRVCGA